MKTSFVLPLFLLIFSGAASSAQNMITIFDKILFYDGYAATVTHPVPPGVIRHRNTLCAIKLTDQQLQSIGDTMVIHVIIKAACDNYDRIGTVHLAFVPKGATTYHRDSVSRIEIARFITPFMNKNRMPDTVPYRFEANNIALMLRDADIRSQYDIWGELQVSGVPYAANKEVFGCAGRNDVFYGSLFFETGIPAPAEAHHVLMPLSFHAVFNNYDSNATDEVGKTEKTISFTLDQDLTDAAFFLITSNHGANSGGEEYNRRNHFVYFNDSQIHQYKPGSPTCEPFRKYNTQANGIYGPSPRTDAEWQSFSNWCPGDVIPIRRLNLGPLSAGTHTFKIAVPDARFNGGQGSIPLSLYLQGKTQGLLSVADQPVPEIQIYPNPASDKVYIRSAAPVSVSVHSMDGRIVARHKYAEQITIGHLPEGVYIIHVQDSAGMIMKTEKLLKAGR